MSLKYVLVALFTLSLSVTHAQKRIDDNQASELIQLSGAKECVGQIGSSFSGGLNTMKGQLPEEIKADFADAYSEGFDIDTLKATMQEAFKNNFNAKHVDKTLEWLNTPLSKKITTLEADASAMSREVPEATPNRKKLIDRLIAASAPAEAMVEMTFGTIKGMAASAARIAGEDVSNLDANLAPARKNMLTIFSSMIPAMFNQVYSPLSDEEFEQYVEFYESAEGKNLNTAIRISTTEAIAYATERSWNILLPKIESKIKKQ